MVNIKIFENIVDEYVMNYRNTSLPPYDVSAPYDFTLKGGYDANHYGWPETYPGCDNPGVYAFFDDAEQLLYIGKASFRNTLGSRISSYVGWSRDKEGCKFFHTWTTQPRYLVTVSVPIELSFEAPALEEYLILKLQPKENSIGLDRN